MLLPIKFITNKNGEKFYPKTHINAVVDDDNLRLSDILKEELTDATNVIGEAIVKIYNEHKVLKDIVLSASYNTVDATNYTCMGQPLVIIGSGAPSVTPKFVGLRYHDNTNRKVYEAFSVTNSVNDWVLLN